MVGISPESKRFHLTMPNLPAHTTPYLVLEFSADQIGGEISLFSYNPRGIDGLVHLSSTEF